MTSSARKHQALSPGFQVKFREASGGPKSASEVSHFSPLVKIQVLDIVQHDFGIADNRPDNIMAAY
jgi:hypothetical protein